MKERPILFSGPMVRGLLDGSKTQTRRVVKPQPTTEIRSGLMGHWSIQPDVREFSCPYGQPGDRLWVRERFCPIYPQDPTYNNGEPIEYDYAATYVHGYRLGDSLGLKKKWKPSIHMPRAASRITLEITGVRVERLQDISEADAIAEGAKQTDGQWWTHDPSDPITGNDPVESYRRLWESINGPGSWDANPWAWAIEFKRVEGGAA